MMTFSKSVAVILVFFLSLAFSPLSFAEDAQTPETASYQFYSWYMKAISEDHQGDLWTDKTFEKFVSKEVVAEIQHVLETEGLLDADYFIRAQDFFDDWVTHISVKQVRATKEDADVLVVLGEKEQKRLLVRLKKQGNSWKITDVTDPD